MMDIRKSGVNLDLALVGETYDAMYAGEVEVLATTQVPLTFDLPAPKPVDEGTAYIPCWQVLAQADPGNADNVLIGDEAHGCHIVLRPGESITIPINNVRKVYVRTADGGGTSQVNWLAMT
jgi:hypothetical protein